jgi:photosystem II stability/assembly factor-like uncharacterized protein
MLSLTKSRYAGKRLQVLFVLLFTLFFSYTVIAQEAGSVRGNYKLTIPEKIHKLVLDPLPAGTYSVGSGSYFPTIDSAFNKLSIDGIAGEVVLELTDDLYTAPTDSFGFFLNGPIPGAGPNSRVTIKPAANKNVTIEGNGFVVVSFTNTSFVTINGVDLTGTTTLTIHAQKNNSFAYNDGIDFLYDSDQNVIQNIIFIQEDNTRSSGSGFWCPQSGSAVPDSNLIQNNFVKQAGMAFFISTYLSSVRADGNVIRGNKIGSETDSLYCWGIQLEKCQNTIVENNIIQNQKITRTSGSDIINVGINSFSGNGDIIRNNIVHNIKSTSGYSCVGILLSGGSGSNNHIYNNMVYDIQSTSSQSNSRVAGIQIWNQANPKIYYNTVYLSGIGSNHAGSAAFYIYGGFSPSSNVDAKNNIFVNTRDESPYCASSIYDYTEWELSSDYNDVYYEPNQYNCLVLAGGVHYLTLEDWQQWGLDLNSLNEIVNFVSPTDIHINNNYYTLLDGAATPITGIDTDFDGDLRNVSTPDIGADEFDLDPNATIWQMQNSHLPSDVFICDFSAPNNQVCWGVGLKNPQAPYVGYIRTVDGGNSWICDTIPGLSNCYTQQVFAIDADTAYVTVFKLIGTSGSNGVYKTTDAGTTWVRQEAYNNSQSGPAYIHFFDVQNGVVIGDPGIETYTTTNGGLTWNPVTMPTIPSNEYTSSRGDGIVGVGNTVWFSTGAHLFKSTDKGYTWTILLDEQQYIGWAGGIAFQDDSIGIYSQKQGTNNLYRKTINGGENWEVIPDPILNSIGPTTSQYIPGTASTYIVGGGTAVTMSGIAVSYDGGDSWSLIDTIGSYQFIFPSSTVGWNSPFTVHNIYKYVGPRIISSVEEEQIKDLVPSGYSLSQNYPNPFNPSTTFSYSVPQPSKVVIKVYDILGNEIAILMDEEKSIGTYELTWNAANLSSGVYFYQLRAGDYVNTKKMILLK